jgi:hypothetical protein
MILQLANVQCVELQDKSCMCLWDWSFSWDRLRLRYACLHSFPTSLELNSDETISGLFCYHRMIKLFYNSKLLIICVQIIWFAGYLCNTFFFTYMQTHVNWAFSDFPHHTVCFRRGGGWQGWFWEGLQKIWLNSTPFFWFFMFSAGDGVGGGLFQWSRWWREGMLQVLDTGKAYQPLHLKDRSVLQGINYLKITLWSCVVEMHPEITNWNL